MSITSQQQIWFDLASITKALATASLILHQLALKNLQLSSSIGSLLPNATLSSSLASTTLRDLLTYQIHFPQATSALLHFPPSQVLQTILTSDITKGPPFPTNSQSIVLSILLESLHHVPFEQQFHHFQNIYAPTAHLTFLPNLHSPLAPTAKTISARLPVHDPTARHLQSAGYYLGHAGLFGTIEDVLQFVYSVYLKNIFSSNSTPWKDLFFNAAHHSAHSASLGWELNQSWMGTTSHEAPRIGKTGFTGTAIIIDQKTTRAVTLLTNWCFFPQFNRSQLAILRHHFFNYACTSSTPNFVEFLHDHTRNLPGLLAVGGSTQLSS